MEKESQAIDYLAALLADIEAKKAALDALAAAVRAAIAAGALGAPSDLQLGSVTVNATVTPTGFAADLPRGAFLGKTATDAIKLYLSTVRKKQTNKEIAQALRDGGLESAGDFGNFVTSALFRLKKEGVVLRFDDGWGLSEWYNEAFRAKLGGTNGKKLVLKPAPKRGKGKPKKSAKKGAAVRPVPAPSTAPQAPVVPTKGIDVRVTEFLNFAAPNGNSVLDIATALKEPVGVVNFSLVRLVKKGEARRVEGQYYATKEP